ncbi:MAG TPA: MauE/DoxX family redox-associated membrane protein [Opitutaceae bacterium]|nr:MauE/DoxX family redox-associated membrane protein [Opitutaceae bacterium]
MNMLARVLRIFLGALFVVAGVLKALDPANFAADIDHYRLLPYFALAPLALYLPWLEIICGLAMIASCHFRRSALILLLAMTVIFTGAVVSALLRHLDITCGCFGAASALPLSFALARNIVLLLMLGWLLRSEGRRAKPGAPGGG